MSLGGEGPLGSAFEAALLRAVNAGAIIVASSGNESEANPGWPARYAIDPRFAGAVIAVGASSGSGGPYGDPSRGLLMPHDVPLTGGAKAGEGEVLTFVHARGAVGPGGWRPVHRIKPPVGVVDERFGVPLSASLVDGVVVLGVGTRQGCRGYIIVLGD